jgi:hypothetical protein
MRYILNTEHYALVTPVSNEMSGIIWKYANNIIVYIFVMIIFKDKSV